MGFETEVVGRLGRFQAEQAAADDGGLAGRLAVGDDLVEVVDGAVDENALLIDARQRRHERGRPGRQHDDIVRNLLPLGGAHDALLAVDLGRPVAEEKRDAVLVVPFGVGEGKLLGLAVVEVFGEVDAVVSGAGFFAEGDDLPLSLGVEFDEPFAKAMTDHAVADDNHSLLAGVHERGVSRADGARQHRTHAYSMPSEERLGWFVHKSRLGNQMQNRMGRWDEVASSPRARMFRMACLLVGQPIRGLSIALPAGTQVSNGPTICGREGDRAASLADGPDRAAGSRRRGGSHVPLTPGTFALYHREIPRLGAHGRASDGGFDNRSGPWHRS